LDAVYVLLQESDAEPDTLTERLDEPLPHELDEQERRRVGLRRHARENREALETLRGLSVG